MTVVLSMHPGGFGAAGVRYNIPMNNETFQVHGEALVRKPRKASKATAPVAVIKVAPEIMAAARATTDCDCKIKPQPDGSVIIVNSTSHCP